MSRILKQGPDQVRECSRIELREIEHGTEDSVSRDKGSIFELSGFLDGMDACDQRMTPQEIIAAAKNRADGIAEDAYRQGFEQGERAGFELGNKKAESVAQELLSMLEEIRKVRRDVLLHGEKEAVTLALGIAEKVIRHEVSVRRELILEVAKQALESVSGEDRIQVILHPEDLAYLEKSKEDLARSVEGLGVIDLHTDETIGRGGCLVKTRLGEIDATIESKLNTIFEQIVRKMQEGQERP